MIGKIASFLLGFWGFLTWPHKTSNDEVRGFFGTILQLGAVALVIYQLTAAAPLSLLWVVIFVFIGLVFYLWVYSLHQAARNPGKRQINASSWE